MEESQLIISLQTKEITSKQKIKSYIYIILQYNNI